MNKTELIQKVKKLEGKFMKRRNQINEWRIQRKISSGKEAMALLAGGFLR